MTGTWAGPVPPGSRWKSKKGPATRGPFHLWILLLQVRGHSRRVAHVGAVGLDHPLAVLLVEHDAGVGNLRLRGPVRVKQLPGRVGRALLDERDRDRAGIGALALQVVEYRLDLGLDRRRGRG